MAQKHRQFLMMCFPQWLLKLSEFQDFEGSKGVRIQDFEESKEIPKDILKEILGPSKVYKQVIKRIINVIVSYYVQKEGLSVGKDLRLEQSFEDLKAIFEQFRF